MNSSKVQSHHWFGSRLRICSCLQSYSRNNTNVCWGMNWRCWALIYLFRHIWYETIRCKHPHRKYNQHAGSHLYKICISMSSLQCKLFTLTLLNQVYSLSKNSKALLEQWENICHVPLNCYPKMTNYLDLKTKFPQIVTMTNTEITNLTVIQANEVRKQKRNQQKRRKNTSRSEHVQHNQMSNVKNRKP